MVVKEGRQGTKVLDFGRQSGVEWRGKTSVFGLSRKLQVRKEGGVERNCEESAPSRSYQVCTKRLGDIVGSSGSSYRFHGRVGSSVERVGVVQNDRVHHVSWKLSGKDPFNSRTCFRVQ